MWSLRSGKLCSTSFLRGGDIYYIIWVSSVQGNCLLPFNYLFIQSLIYNIWIQRYLFYSLDYNLILCFKFGCSYIVPATAIRSSFCWLPCPFDIFPLLLLVWFGLIFSSFFALWHYKIFPDNIIYSPPKPQNQPFLQGVLAPFIGENKIRVECAYSFGSVVSRHLQLIEKEIYMCILIHVYTHICR